MRVSFTIALVPAGDGSKQVIAGAYEVLACVPGSKSPQGWPPQLIMQVSTEACNCNVGE